MAKKSKNLVRLEYGAARIAFLVLGALPRKIAVSLSIGIMRALPFFIRELRHTGMTNLAIAFPEKSLVERSRILKGSFENLGRVLGELSQFHKYSRENLADILDLNLDAEAQSVYEQNEREKRGVLVVTGHLGNWELSVFGFSALYKPMSFFARPLDNPKLDAFLNGIRSRYGNTPINKKNAALAGSKILRDGGILGILSDVNVQPKEGVFVPFFGMASSTTSGPATIALRSNSLIYPIFCVWAQSERKYKLVHGALLEPVNTGNRKQDIIDTTAAFTAEIEKIIRTYPDQWMWIHKRWKTRPPGERDVYDRDKRS